jgi:hypothetical protein
MARFADSDDMLIDATQVMYSTLQVCRHTVKYGATVLALDVLDVTIDCVKRQRKLIVHIPNDWKRREEIQKSAVPIWARLRRNNVLSDANQKLLALIEIGAGELRRLCMAESEQAVRRLGYAFHMIPALLWTPEEFRPEWYMHCLRLVGGYWDALSVEMQQAFCDVLNLTLDEATTLVNSDGFSFDQGADRGK